MNFHLIAIGGSIMHNLAIDLQDLGHQVTGSDDEIYEPSKGRLLNHGLLPEKMGWDEDRITASLDTVILGKHAKLDNPELKKAKDLGLQIKSFPEFISSVTKAGKRIAITGSHGKTSTTAMAMYVMKQLGYEFDYLVGAQIEGFDKMVKMSGADIIIVEGDEYPSSCLDNRAKMLHYDANVSVITGIAWDHVNIYKTYEAYVEIFDRYLKQRAPSDQLYFDQTDPALLDLILSKDYPCTRTGYGPLEVNRKGEIIWEERTYPIEIFGLHNLKNLNAARLVCNQIGINTPEFLQAIKDFKGAAKRLERLTTRNGIIVYKDFAHAPSKAQATAMAVRSKHPTSRITAILELHTFSSLTMAFIEHYKETLKEMDEVFVFYDPQAVKSKGMPALIDSEIEKAFHHPKLKVLSQTNALEDTFIKLAEKTNEVVLIMSSGNLGGIELKSIF